MVDIGVCVGPVCTTFGTDGNSSSLVNSTFFSNSTCTLSPRDSALSSVLLALVGSILTGLTGGAMTAFFTAWISWFAIFRVLLTAIWAVVETLRLRPLEGGDQFFKFWKPLRGQQAFDFYPEGAVANGPTVLGWIGWTFSALYAPTVEIMWLIGRGYHAPGGIKLVRALGVSVTALPLTVDTRARYGRALGELLGLWADCVFNFITALSCLLLGTISAMLMILAVMDLHIQWYLIVLYVFYSLVWMYMSFGFEAPRDEARSANSIASIVAGFAMGCVESVFLGIPALILMLNSPTTPGVGLTDYIKCDSVATWEKFVAIGRVAGGDWMGSEVIGGDRMGSEVIGWTRVRGAHAGADDIRS